MDLGRGPNGDRHGMLQALPPLAERGRFFICGSNLGEPKCGKGEFMSCIEYAGAAVVLEGTTMEGTIEGICVNVVMPLISEDGASR